MSKRQRDVEEQEELIFQLVQTLSHEARIRFKERFAPHLKGGSISWTSEFEGHRCDSPSCAKLDIDSRRRVGFALRVVEELEPEAAVQARSLLLWLAYQSKRKRQLEMAECFAQKLKPEERAKLDEARARNWSAINTDNRLSASAYKARQELMGSDKMPRQDRDFWKAIARGLIFVPSIEEVAPSVLASKSVKLVGAILAGLIFFALVPLFCHPRRTPTAAPAETMQSPASPAATSFPADGGLGDDRSTANCRKREDPFAVKACLIALGDRIQRTLGVQTSLELRVSSQSERFAAARQAYEEALQLKYDGNASAGRVVLGKELEVPKHLLSDWQDLEALDRLASLFARVGKYEEALQQIERGIRLKDDRFAQVRPRIGLVTGEDCYLRYATMRRTGNEEQAAEAGFHCVRDRRVTFDSWSPYYCELGLAMDKESGPLWPVVANYAQCMGQYHQRSREQFGRDGGEWNARWGHLADTGMILKAQQRMEAMLAELSRQERAIILDRIAIWTEAAGRDCDAGFVVPLLWRQPAKECADDTSGLSAIDAKKTWRLRVSANGKESVGSQDVNHLDQVARHAFGRCDVGGVPPSRLYAPIKLKIDVVYSAPRTQPDSCLDMHKEATVCFLPGGRITADVAQCHP